MTSSASSAQIERKARPIYDLLDDGAYPTALQQLQKLLKKHPDSDLLYSLRFFALARLGKREEALETFKLINDPKKPVTQDESVVQALVFGLKTLGLTREIKDLYERLCSANPLHLEWKQQLFLTCCRVGDYQGQQRVAAQLYQSQKSVKSPSNRYLFWNIVSYVLCAQYEQDPMKKKMSLTLADRMLQKCVDEKRFDSVEELKFYLFVLEMQGKHAQALEFVEGEWGQKMKMEMERDKLQLSLLSKLKLWDRLCAEGLAIWRKYPDDFECFQLSLEAAKNHLDSSTRLLEVHAAAKDLCDQELSGDSKYPRRGPFIAMMEHALSVNSCEKLLNAMEQYFKIFSSKLCSFSDMSKYVYLIFENFNSDETAQMLLKRLEKYRKPIDSESSAADNRKRITTEICLEKIKRILTPVSSDRQLEESKRLYQRYLDTLVYGKDLDIMELQPSDDFVLMSVHSILLNYMNTESKDVKAIIEACSMLEQGLKNSKPNFQFKLLLIQLYRLIGCVDGMKRIYLDLDIKNILHDTVGYRVMNHLNSLGNDIHETVTMLTKSYSIYTSNRRETPEVTIQAYQYETYSRVPEFVAFGKKLESSLQRVTTSHLLNYAVHWQELLNDKSQYNGTTSHDNVENISEWSAEFLSGLQDTRDYTLMHFFETPAQKSDLESFVKCKHVFTGSVDYVKLSGCMEALLTAENFDQLKNVAISLKDMAGTSDFVKRISHHLCDESYNAFCEPMVENNVASLISHISASLDELLFAKRLIIRLKYFEKPDIALDMTEIFKEELARIEELSTKFNDKFEDQKKELENSSSNYKTNVEEIFSSWLNSLYTIKTKMNLLK